MLKNLQMLALIATVFMVGACATAKNTLRKRFGAYPESGWYIPAGGGWSLTPESDRIGKSKLTPLPHQRERPAP